MQAADILTPPKRVYFLVLDGVHLLDLAGPAQILSNIDDLDLHYISPRSEVCAAQGMSINKLESLPEKIPLNSWLLLIGTRVLDTTSSETLAKYVPWLTDTLNDDTLLATVCSGALLAAAAGLLDGYECTTHHSLTGRLQRLAPKARVIENRIFVGTGRLWTSAGISTGIDLLLYLVAQYWGHQQACVIARELVLYQRRSGSDPQLNIWLDYRNHVHQRVHELQDLLTQDPARDWTLDELAESVHISKRHLSRIFNRHTGTSIGDYLQSLRLSVAEMLLKQSQYSVERVAEQAGFGSTRQFRRLWSRAKLLSPQDWRKQCLPDVL